MDKDISSFSLFKEYSRFQTRMMVYDVFLQLGYSTEKLCLRRSNVQGINNWSLKSQSAILRFLGTKNQTIPTTTIVPKRLQKKKE
jgi:hypothetical protein